MRTTKFIPLLALVVFLTCSLPAFSAAPEEKPAADGVQTLYIYGVSQNLNDSIVYVRDRTGLTGTHLLENDDFVQPDH